MRGFCFFKLKILSVPSGGQKETFHKTISKEVVKEFFLAKEFPFP